MYKSCKIIDYHPMSPSPKPFGTYSEPEQQETINIDYESIRRLIKSMDKIDANVMQCSTNEIFTKNRT